MVAVASARTLESARHQNISEAQLNAALSEARLPPRDYMASSMEDLRSSIVSVRTALYPSGRIPGPAPLEATQELFNQALRDGLTLPDNTTIRWRDHESIEGRLYIENNGVGVSFRPGYGDTYVYTYEDGRRHTKECAFITTRKGERPSLDRLENAHAYGERAQREPRLIEEAPREVQLAAAYLKRAGIALTNLRRQATEEALLG